MIQLLLVLLCISLQGFSVSPRLLLILDNASCFEHSELSEEIECHYLSCPDTEVAESLNKLEEESSNHLVLYDGNSNNLAKLARLVGYDYLLLPPDIDTAVEEIKIHLSSMPLTDADLPHTDPNTTGQFYALMMQVDKIFNAHGIRYFATCGTLLGAVRHEGMIPWDDDIDICILERDVPFLLSLKDALEKYGLCLGYHEVGGFYKIFYKDGLKIVDNSSADSKLHPWTYPYIDIFSYKDTGSCFEYSSAQCRKIWPQEIYQYSELSFPLESVKFGPMYIPVPHNRLEILSRFYGPDWNRVAFVKYNHKEEQSIKKIKVDLVDRSAPAYIIYQK